MKLSRTHHTWEFFCVSYQYTDLNSSYVGVHIDVLLHSLPVLQHSTTNLTEEPILSDNITHTREVWKTPAIVTTSVTHISIHQVTQCCISYCNVVHTLPEVGRLTIPSTCKVDMSAAAVDWEDWWFFSIGTAAGCFELDMLSVECEHCLLLATPTSAVLSITVLVVGEVKCYNL